MDDEKEKIGIKEDSIRQGVEEEIFNIFCGRPTKK